jgi:hypothetical protein
VESKKERMEIGNKTDNGGRNLLYIYVKLVSQTKERIQAEYVRE